MKTYLLYSVKAEHHFLLFGAFVTQHFECNSMYNVQMIFEICYVRPKRLQVCFLYHMRIAFGGRFYRSTFLHFIVCIKNNEYKNK